MVMRGLSVVGRLRMNPKYVVGKVVMHAGRIGAGEEGGDDEEREREM